MNTSEIIITTLGAICTSLFLFGVIKMIVWFIPKKKTSEEKQDE